MSDKHDYKKLYALACGQIDLIRENSDKQLAERDKRIAELEESVGQLRMELKPFQETMFIEKLAAARREGAKQLLTFMLREYTDIVDVWKLSKEQIFDDYLKSQAEGK